MEWNWHGLVVDIVVPSNKQKPVKLLNYKQHSFNVKIFIIITYHVSGG